MNANNNIVFSGLFKLGLRSKMQELCLGFFIVFNHLKVGVI